MKPIFADPCNHRAEDFKGNIRFKDGMVADLYIYPANVAGVYEEKGTLHYCLRFSNQGPDYTSGKVTSLFSYYPFNFE